MHGPSFLKIPTNFSFVFFFPLLFTPETVSADRPTHGDHDNHNLLRRAAYSKDSG